MPGIRQSALNKVLVKRNDARLMRIQTTPFIKGKKKTISTNEVYSFTLALQQIVDASMGTVVAY